MADAISSGMSGAAAGSAFGPWGALIGGGLGMLGGGLFSGASNPEDLWREYLSTLPDYQTLINAGQAAPSAFGSITEDPALRGAQMNALRSLQTEGARQGLTLEDQSALTQALNRTGQNDRAMRQAVLQQMAMRGQSGSGAELATQLAGQQQETQANGLAGAQAAGDARQRALAAMAGAGQLGGQIRGQDWNQAAQRAAATDAINTFNASNRLNAYGMRMGAAAPGYSGMASGSNEQYQRGVGQGGAAGAALGGLGQYAASNWGSNAPTRGGSTTGIDPGSDYRLKTDWPGGY